MSHELKVSIDHREGVAICVISANEISMTNGRRR
jgi:hypothetical protein